MTQEPIKVFFSYSHQDEAYKDELVKHLSILQRQGVIAGWHDRMITPGSEWDREIDRHLSAANIILLLVSSDFLSSDYCWSVEITKALQRHEAGEAHVIPVVLRHVNWHDTPIAKLQALPENANPIKSWPDQDKAFTNVAGGIQKAADTIQERRKRKRTRQSPASRKRFTPTPSVGSELRAQMQTYSFLARVENILGNFCLVTRRLSPLVLLVLVALIFVESPKEQPMLPNQPVEKPVESGSTLNFRLDVPPAKEAQPMLIGKEGSQVLAVPDKGSQPMPIDKEGGQFPIVETQGVTLKVVEVRHQKDWLVMDVTLQNASNQPVQFRYRSLNIFDEQGNVIKADMAGLPEELPARSEPFIGTITISKLLLDKIQKLSLKLSNYPDHKIIIHMYDIPVKVSPQKSRAID
jgi:TIR domain